MTLPADDVAIPVATEEDVSAALQIGEGLYQRPVQPIRHGLRAGQAVDRMKDMPLGLSRHLRGQGLAPLRSRHLVDEFPDLRFGGSKPGGVGTEIGIKSRRQHGGE